MLARPVRSAASHASRRSLFTLPVLPYPVEGALLLHSGLRARADASLVAPGGLLPTINAKGTSGAFFCSPVLAAHARATLQGSICTTTSTTKRT